MSYSKFTTMVKQRKRVQARENNDALTGDRNEFISSPVTSGEKAGASGASKKPTHKTPAKAKAKAGRKTPGSKSLSGLSFGGESSRKKAARVSMEAEEESGDASTPRRKVSEKHLGFKTTVGGQILFDDDQQDPGSLGDSAVPGPQGQCLATLPDGRTGLYDGDVLVGVVGPVDGAPQTHLEVNHSPSASSTGQDDEEDASSAAEDQYGAEGEEEFSPPAEGLAPVSRRLVSSRVDPLGREVRPALADYVLSLAENVMALDLINVVNVARRRRARTRLMDHFRIQKQEAERLLKVSYLAHRRFVALDGEEASEHLGLAFLVGRVLHEGEHFLGKPKTPGKSKASTPVPPYRTPVQAPPVTPSRRSEETEFQSQGLFNALDKVCETLRKGLPQSLADEAIQALVRSNDALRAVKTAPSPATTTLPSSAAADLGRGYRLGEIARESKSYANRVNKLGARESTGDSPQAGWFQADRRALFNSPDKDILRTLSKVMKGGDAYTHLNSRQKLQAISRLVRERLHRESLEDRAHQSKPAEGIQGEEDEGSSDSGSMGDSCASESRDSRKSSESYERDSFCRDDDSEENAPVRKARAGRASIDGGSSGGSSSSEDVDSSDSDCSDEGRFDSKDARRAKERRDSANSLGTPKKKLAPVLHVSEKHGRKNQLVLLGDEDLPMWKTGSARFKNGFRYESYIHHKQQFDNYKAHRGRFSERTFKSIIHANLIPVVCASCGFRRSKWNLLDDERLILRIERVLRPSRSTDFAMELKAIKLLRDGDESLQSSYSTFAELFIGKIAEAEDAGKPVKNVVIKAAFKEAVNKELPLKTWLEGDTWRGVNRAHARLLRKLREARSWEAMTKTVLKAKSARRGDEHEQDDAPSVAREQPRGGRRVRKRTNSTSRKARGDGQGKRGSRAVRKVKFNNTREERGGARSGSRGDKLRTWQGLDGRGASWHTDAALYECYKRPCQAPFCQRCARHGHTADTCRVPDGVEGLCMSGYFQEKRPGKVGPRRPPPKNNSTRKGRDEEEHEAEDEGAADDGWDEDEHEAHQNARSVKRTNNTQGEGSRGPRGRARL